MASKNFKNSPALNFISAQKEQVVQEVQNVQYNQSDIIIHKKYKEHNQVPKEEKDRNHLESTWHFSQKIWNTFNVLVGYMERVSLHT